MALMLAIVPVAGAMAPDAPPVLFGGGEGPAFPGTDRTVVHRPVEEALGFWIDRNGCSSTPVAAASWTGRGLDMGQSIRRLTWSGCTAPVEHFELHAVGHGWPGIRLGALRRTIIGRPNALLDASEDVWAFAPRYTR